MEVIFKTSLVWLAGFVGLVLLDFLWLGVIASGFYRNQLGHLMHLVDDRMVVNIPAALATWAVIVTGVYLFVLPRFMANGSFPQLLLWGALFGVILYAVYDLTNLAVLKDWPHIVTVVDITWGGIVCSMTGLCMGLAHQGVTRWL